MEHHRLETLESAFLDLSGRLTATELAVRVLIATHPDIDALSHAWQATMPGLIDSLMMPEHQRNRDYGEGMRNQMSIYSLEIQKWQHVD